MIGDQHTDQQASVAARIGWLEFRGTNLKSAVEQAIEQRTGDQPLQ
jgi:hypothetical protein